MFEELLEKGGAYIENWHVTESMFGLYLHGRCLEHHAVEDEVDLPVTVHSTRIMGIGDGTITTMNTVYRLGAHRDAKEESNGG
tara:strand:- start:163 stop:411 length:249 start_codon:yes stop_codon:yes gene_type:complete